MPPSGIRTHNLSRRAAVGLRLKPGGYRDRQTKSYKLNYAIHLPTFTSRLAVQISFPHFSLNFFPVLVYFFVCLFTFILFIILSSVSYRLLSLLPCYSPLHKWLSVSSILPVVGSASWLYAARPQSRSIFSTLTKATSSLSFPLIIHIVQ